MTRGARPPHRAHRRGNVLAPAARQRGNVFAMLFAAVALTGVLAAVGMQTLTGPVSTITRVTQRNVADNNLLMNAKIIVNAAVTAVAGGDSDGDGIIEPTEFVPAAIGETPPTNGGFLPTDLGLALTDPWGTKYGYCVWDHGTTNTSTNRLTGDNTSTASTQVVLALIAAGPDKTFQTTCSVYSGAPVQVTKASGSDDLIFKYSYAEAAASSNGLWTINVSDDAKAELKDTSGSAVNVTIDRDTGIGDFLGLTTSVISAKTDQTIALDGGLLLDADGGGATTCTAAEKGSLRLNTDRDDLELCDGAGGWVEVRTPPGGSAGHVQFNDGADGFAGDANLFWDNSAKRLGVGGSPSTYTLDVTGTLGTSGNAAVGGTLGVTGATTLSSTLDVTDSATLSSTLSVSGNATFNTDTLYVDADNDRVGVGTASPSHLLDVTGAADMGALGSLTTSDAVLHVDDGTSNLYVDGRAVISDGGFILGTTGAESLQLVTDETQRILIAADGTVSITGNTGISGATSLWSTLTVAGIANFDAGTFYVDVPDRRVGIGTTDPLTKLDVTGGIRIGGDTLCNISKAGMVAWNSGVLQLCGADGNWASLAAIDRLDDIGDVYVSEAGTPNNNDILAWDSTNTRWVAKNVNTVGSAVADPGGLDKQVQFNDGGTLAGAAQLYWDKTNNRLGIGTASPNARLELAGSPASIRLKDTANTTASNTLAGIISFRDSADAEYGWIGDGSSFSNDITVYSAAGSAKLFSANGGVTVLSGGNVGIGTVTPQSRLHVAGGIQLGDDTAACPGASNVKLGTLRFNAGALQVCTASGWGSVSSAGVPCPGGFTQIAAQGRVLGCMQTNENSIANWPAAASACFVNYGGRLPTSAEWYLAAANYSLSNETGNWEWLSDAVGETSNYDNHAVVGGTAVTDFSWGYDTATYAYRCFIPASSGGAGSGGGSGTAPAFSVNRNGVDQNVTASTEVKVDFTSKAFDVTGAFDLATDRFTPQTPGKYILVASAYCPSATGYCQIFIRKNGANASTNYARGAGINASPQTTAVIDMNGTTDYVDVSVLSAPGTTINGTAHYTYFTGSLLGGLGGSSGGGGEGSSTGGTVVPGWPDAIRCAGSAGSVVLNFGWQNTAGTHTSYTLAGDYGTVGSNTPRLVFTSASSPATLDEPGWTNWATDCGGKTIPELYASGQAFNFVGGAAAGSGDVFWRSGLTYSVSGNHANCIAPTEALMNDDNVTGNMSWGSASASGAQWIRADLGGIKPVNRIKVGGPLQCPGWTSCSNSYYEGAELQISNDGSTWTTVKTFTAGDYSNSTLMTHSFPTENARYVRLYKSNSWMCTGQFRVGFQSGDTLAGLECATGEIPKWNGTAWACATDGGGSGSSGTEVSFFAHKNGTNQTGATSGVNTQVTFSTETFDTNNNFDPGASRFTPTVAGKYLLSASAAWNSGINNSFWIVGIRKNGSTIAQNSTHASNGALMGAPVSVIVDANGSTDYFDVTVYQNSGSAQTINGSLANTYFSGALLDGGGGGDDTLSGLSCASGEIPKWNGTAWECAEDGGGKFVDGDDPNDAVYTAGNVGIGTATPSQKLEVVGSIKAASGLVWSANGLNATSRSLLLENFDDTANVNGVDIGVKLGGTEFQGLSWVQETAWTSGSAAANKDVMLQLGVLNDNTPANRVFVKANGNVGIGMASPTVRLEVQTSADAGVDGLRVKSPSAGHITLAPDGAAGSWNALTQAGDAALIFSDGTIDTGNFVIGPWATGAKGIRITSAGNVGIGTTAPGAPLEIAGSNMRLQLLTGTSSSGYTAQIGVNDDGVNLSNNSASRGFNFKNANGTLVTVTASGAVGIGTASPVYRLDVGGSSRFTGTALFNSTVDISGASFYLRTGDDVSYVDQRMYTSDGSTADYWRFLAYGKSYASAPWQRKLRIMSYDGGTGSDVMTLMANGNIGIGVTSPTYRLDMDGSLRITGHYYANGNLYLGQNNTATSVFGSTGAANYLQLAASDSADDGARMIVYGRTHGSAGRVYLQSSSNSAADLVLQVIRRTSAGTTYAVKYTYGNGRTYFYGTNGSGSCYIDGNGPATTCTSDERLKKDIEPIPNALETLVKVRGVSFNWKEDFKNDPGRKKYGVIAQELQAAFPDLVVEGDDGYLQASMDGLIPVLVEATKELKADNDNLRADLKAANDNYEELRREVEALKAGR